MHPYQKKCSTTVFVPTSWKRNQDYKQMSLLRTESTFKYFYEVQVQTNILQIYMALLRLISIVNIGTLYSSQSKIST